MFDNEYRDNRQKCPGIRRRVFMGFHGRGLYLENSPES